LSFGPYKPSELDDVIPLHAHRPIAFTMIFLKAGNCSSTFFNIIIGSLVGRNCRLLCKLTMGSSLTVFK
jgi:hypothetical protein